MWSSGLDCKLSQYRRISFITTEWAISSCYEFHLVIQFQSFPSARSDLVTSLPPSLPHSLSLLAGLCGCKQLLTVRSLALRLGTREVNLQSYFPEFVSALPHFSPVSIRQPPHFLSLFLIVTNCHCHCNAPVCIVLTTPYSLMGGFLFQPRKPFVNLNGTFNTSIIYRFPRTV